MADLSNNSSVAVVIETVAGTFIAPSNADLLQCADLKVAINGITVNVNEYTGSIHKPGDIVLGKTLDISFKLYMRGPGGTAPPAAGAWVPGRVLRSAGFAELIQAAAIPVAAEALGAGGTTTKAVLGTGAASTVDLYTALLVSLAQLATINAPKSFTPIRDYQAAKNAVLGITLGAAATGNYQLPKQLAYQLSPSASVPTLSMAAWHGNRRFDGVGMAISAFKINMPAAGRGNTELPSIEVTYSGDLQTDADEAAPVVTPGLAIPPFRDGVLAVGGIQMGGSSVTIDLNAQAAYPPNPNKPSGNDAAQLASTTRTASLTLNQASKAFVDFTALADGQVPQPIVCQWGAASGNLFSVIVTDCRLNYRSPDAGGDFVANSGDAYIDGASKDVAIIIPFF